MKTKTTVLSIHELGQRANQEDTIWPDINNSSHSEDLFILCDGMGGHECGEVASQTVCETMSAYIRSHVGTDDVFTEADFNEALSAAYDALDAKDNGSVKKMGTTLTFVKFHAGGCFIAHIGDSRVYYFRPSERSFEYITRDHSLVNDLVALGELTPEEAKVSTQKNVITRAMQPLQEKRSRADCINITDVQPGDYIYMCSDGMLENSEDNEIANILSLEVSDKEKVKIFIGATKENRDNHSAHLIKVVSVEGAPVMTGVAAGVAEDLEPEIEPEPEYEPEEVAAPVVSRKRSWIALALALLVVSLGAAAAILLITRKPGQNDPDKPEVETVDTNVGNSGKPVIPAATTPPATVNTQTNRATSGNRGSTYRGSSNRNNTSNRNSTSGRNNTPSSSSNTTQGGKDNGTAVTNPEAGNKVEPEAGNKVEPETGNKVEPETGNKVEPETGKTQSEAQPSGEQKPQGGAGEPASSTTSTDPKTESNPPTTTSTTQGANKE